MKPQKSQSRCESARPGGKRCAHFVPPLRFAGMTRIANRTCIATRTGSRGECMSACASRLQRHHSGRLWNLSIGIFRVRVVARWRHA
eukprot:6777602-Prymnesium_polylepis.2